MNEYDRLSRLADSLREKYPPGTRIELIHMEDEIAPVEDGMRGTVRFIDDMGQMHMGWDNGRTLAINADTDRFRALTPEECYDERIEKCSSNFYDTLNNDILPKIDWNELGIAYDEENFDSIKGLLRKIHNGFVDAFGSDTLNRDMGFVTVPGVVKSHDGRICLALLDIDTSSSGEHWGTTFLTPHGVYQSEESCHPLAKVYASTMCPYEYWYTPQYDGDHHIDYDNCPKEIKNMIEDVVNDGIEENGGITY